MDDSCQQAPQSRATFLAANVTLYFRLGYQPFRAHVSAAPLKQRFSLSLLSMQAGHFRAHVSAAPFMDGECGEAGPGGCRARDYCLRARATRLESLEMPSGSLTFHSLSL